VGTIALNFVQRIDIGFGKRAQRQPRRVNWRPIN
jgi:hypothetical protein